MRAASILFLTRLGFLSLSEVLITATKSLAQRTVVDIFVMRTELLHLFDVPGQQGNCCFLSDMGINDAGVVVGTIDPSIDFIRSADGSQYVLLDPGGLGFTTLVGINNQGELVGNAFPPPAVTRGFFCTPDGNTCTQLPDVPFVFLPSWQIRASGINDSGEIVGTFGQFGTGPYSFCTGPCAGSLLPSPEIDTGSMAIAALSGIFLLRLWKKEFGSLVPSLRRLR